MPSTEQLPCVTDPDAFRALCEELVSAESCDSPRAETLRAMVDAAAFGECPDCLDKDDYRADCKTCSGDGFVPFLRTDGPKADNAL